MSPHDKQGEAEPAATSRDCSAAEIGAIAHLYRGEIYRSTVWRTRLDSTTNWAVVTTGIALSATFSSADASREENVVDSAIPMVTIDQLVVLSRRVRQMVLR